MLVSTQASPKSTGLDTLENILKMAMKSKNAGFEVYQIINDHDTDIFSWTRTAQVKEMHFSISRHIEFQRRAPTVCDVE